MKDIYKILENLGIKYEKHEHPAVFTSQEAAEYDRGIEGGKSKNLFLRNNKGDRHYLVIIESMKRADLEKLASSLNESKLSFASPERLLKHLGVTPGSVSPFGLINDTGRNVQVVIDKKLMKYERLCFHPNINTATIVISTNDFRKFLDFTGNRVTYLKL